MVTPKDKAEQAEETAIKEKAAALMAKPQGTAAPSGPGAQTPATAKRNAVMADLAARHKATIDAANAEEARKKAIPVRRNDSRPLEPPRPTPTPTPKPEPTPPRPPTDPFPSMAHGMAPGMAPGMGASTGGDPAAFNAKVAEVKNSVGGSPMGTSPGMKRGGAVRSKPQTKFSSGGSVGSTSRRGDGIAQRGKTRGTMR